MGEGEEKRGPPPSSVAFDFWKESEDTGSRHRPANRPGVPTRKTTPVMCSDNRCPELAECACAPFPWLPSAPTVALVAVPLTITCTVAKLCAARTHCTHGCWKHANGRKSLVAPRMLRSGKAAVRRLHFSKGSRLQTRPLR